MSKKYASKVDVNQPTIVKWFRDHGCSVAHTHNAGLGFPDLVVGINGLNLLVEVKDGDKPPSARKLTKDQEKWHGEWSGQVAIVKDVNECRELLEQFNVYLI